ncbi:MAG TPA: hypothetical protein VK866_15370 [Acidimicrobiales bacterium]|nr:hypothetical protein [Acidimicrobiales bacterium]
MRPIEHVARDLRELRRTLAVVRATEALAPSDPAVIDDLRRRLDATLLEAARSLEIVVPIEWVAADGGLTDAGRVTLLDAVVAAGLALGEL